MPTFDSFTFCSFLDKEFLAIDAAHKKLYMSYTETPTSPCAGPAATQAVNITSLEAAFIPGYNRFPMNDFPRVAVSDPAGVGSSQ